MKRLITISLALLMVLSLFPPVLTARAEEPSGYYYQQLDATSQAIYRVLDDMQTQGTLQTGRHSVDLVERGVLANQPYERSALTAIFSAARDAFLLDHADLFYVDFDKLSITLTQSGNDYRVLMGVGRDESYLRDGFTPGDVAAAVSAFDRAADAIAASAPADASREEKVRTAFRGVMDAASYALEADARPANVPYVRTPYGALVRGEAVCEGYARALKAVLDRMGIQSVLVQGYYDAEPYPGPHMWNYVRMDDNRWYLLDATMSDGEGFDQHFLLPGISELVLPYLPDGAISLSDTSKTFRYPTLSPVDYQAMSADAFTVTGEGAGAFVSYRDMGIVANRNAEEPRYLLASYNGTTWYYLENLLRHTVYTMNGELPESQDPADFMDAETGFTNFSQYPYLAVTDEPRPTEFDIAHRADYYHFDLTGHRLYDLYQLGQAEELRKAPPHVVSRTPESSAVEAGGRYEVTIRYSEALTLQDPLQEASVSLHSSDTGAELTDFSWERDSDTLRFTLDVGEDFGHSIHYFVTPVNLKGAESGEAPDAVVFTRYNLPKYACPKVYSAINEIHANVPALIADSDLSQEGWKDEAGQPIGQDLPFRLALVASALPVESTDTTLGSAKFKDLIEEKAGQEVKAAQTFDISLTLCSSQVSYISGRRVKVYIPFPAGYDAASPVSYKAYHYNKTTQQVEEVECVAAQGGIILLCDAFSPFAVAALPLAEKAGRSVMTHADGHGSFTQQSLSLNAGESRTLTVTADSGYRIASLTLDGNALPTEQLRTVGQEIEIPLSYDQLRDSGSILEASFRLAEITTETPDPVPPVGDGYSAALSSTQTHPTVGDTLQVYISASHSSDTYYAAGELSLRYDAELLAFDPDRSVLHGAQAHEEDRGILKLTHYGEDKSLGGADSYTLAFTAVKEGVSQVELTSAAFIDRVGAETQDLIPAQISQGTVTFTAAHSVTLPEGFLGDATVAYGSDYEFRAENPYYVYSFTAEAGGQSVEVTSLGGGSYRVSDVRGNLTVTLVSSTPRTYSVTLEGEVESQDGPDAFYGTDYRFTLKEDVEPGVANGVRYSLASLTIGGQEYSNYSMDGRSYSIPGTAITGDVKIVISAQTLDFNQYTVRVNGEHLGEVLTPLEDVAPRDGSYTLQLKPIGGYDYHVTVSDDKGETVPHIQQTDDATHIISYTVEKVESPLVFTVSKTVNTDGVEVSEYLNLGSNRYVWLVTKVTALDPSIVPTYQGQPMYWSPAYGPDADEDGRPDGAYCCLVIASDLSLDEARAAIGTLEGQRRVLNYDGDVNLSGHVDASDAQLIYNLYNIRYSDFSDSVTQEKFLLADVNADRQITTEDAVAVISRILQR